MGAIAEGLGWLRANPGTFLAALGDHLLLSLAGLASASRRPWWRWPRWRCRRCW
jgi:hypothetical protein